MIENKKIMTETYYYNREKVMRFFQALCVVIVVCLGIFTTNFSFYVVGLIMAALLVLIAKYLDPRIATIEILDTKTFSSCFWLNRHKIKKMIYQENTKIFFLSLFVFLALFFVLMGLSQITKDPYRILSLIVLTLLPVTVILDVVFHFVYKFESIDTYDKKELNTS